MTKNRFLTLIIALLVGFNILMFVPTSKALFHDSITVVNNNIGIGSWPSITPTPSPTPSPSPTPNPNAADTRIDPAGTTVAVGQNFTVNLIVSNAQDMGGFQATIAYNPSDLEFVSASLGAFLSSTGRTVVPLGPTVNSTAGTVTYGAYSLSPNPLGPNGEGVVASFTFKANVVGQSNLNISKMQVNRRQSTVQPNGQLSGGIVIVK